MSTYEYAVGERIVERYIKHVAASTTNSPLTAAKSMAANRSQFFANNLSHLAFEGVDSLVSTEGFGVSAKDATVIGALRDGGRGDDPANPEPWADIPWDPRNSQLFGPFRGIPDAFTQGSDPRPCLRPVHFMMQMDIDATNTESAMYFAMTASDNPDALNAGEYLAFHKEVINTTGLVEVSLTLLPIFPAASILPDTWTSRPAAYAFGPTTCPVRRFYLWFGWRLINAGTGANQVISMNAFEARD